MKSHTKNIRDLSNKKTLSIIEGVYLQYYSGV